VRFAKNIIFKSSKLELLVSLWQRGIGIEFKRAAKTHSSFIEDLIGQLKKDV